MTRDSSPPDAIFARARGGSPGFAAKSRLTSSMPCGLGRPPNTCATVNAIFACGNPSGSSSRVSAALHSFAAVWRLRLSAFPVARQCALAFATRDSAARND